MDKIKYIVTSTPHIRSSETTDKIMKTVTAALVPAALAGIWFFGLRAVLIIAISIASSVLFEALYQKITKQPVTISDFSAVVTGLLLALNLPASSPVWIPIVGCFFAIVVVKQLFGGLGQNFMNPALAARAVLLAAYPVNMTKFTSPSGLFSLDTVSSATPLALLKSGEAIIGSAEYIAALSGNIAGCIGETSAIALLLGGLYLIYKQVISWRIPATYIGTVFILTLVFGRGGIRLPFYEILIGGLMLGAFFMATDYSSSPVTPPGQLIMGLSCGLLTWLIRTYGGYPEGVTYSILLMNLAVPLIDKYAKPRVFGTKRKGIKLKNKSREASGNA